MATNALTTINKAVEEFMLGYKKPLEDAFIYLKHACDCVRDFHLYDSPNVVTSKVAVSALGIVEMPTDMIGFNWIGKFVDGQMWSFTRRDDIAVTTTFTGLVEGQDATFGEGEELTDPVSDTYGGVGGVNDYYYTIDWKARRIFCEGIISDTIILKYTTSGIEITDTTYIPVMVVQLITDYLLWKECYFVPELARYTDLRERNYTRTEAKIRNLINSLSYEEWHDLLLSITTQAPLR